MKSLAQIEKISDLDSRVIHAAALLEAELRPPAADSRQETKLGDLVQQQKCFAVNGFRRDVNFALGVRNAIAHYSDRAEPSSAEKTRAADYLIRAVRLVRQAAGRNVVAAASRGTTAPQPGSVRQAAGRNVVAAAAQSQVADTFDKAATQAALRAIYRGRVATRAFGGAAIVLGAVALSVIEGNPLPPPLILAAGVFLATSMFFGRMGSKSISRRQYYSLPGSRFSDGDHRCIFCGLRGRDGCGIYAHGQYKSSTKYHKCSNCERELFTS